MNKNLLRQFNDIEEYDFKNVEYPSISLIKNSKDVFYRPYSYMVLKYNVTDISQPCKLAHIIKNVDYMWVDNKTINKTSEYNFDSIGEHIVKFGFNETSLNDTSGMFFNCESLVDADLTNCDLSNVEKMTSMFNGCVSLIKVNFKNAILKKNVIMSTMFCNCGFKEINFSEIFKNVDTANIKDISGIFNGCSNLETAYVQNVDLSNASGATTMPSIFLMCDKLKHVDFSNSKLNSAYPIYRCNSLTSVDFSNVDFNDSGNDTFAYILNTNSNLKIANFSGCKANKLQSMRGSSTSLETIDFSNSDLPNLTSLSFYDSPNLNNVNFSNCNLPSLTSTQQTFIGCKSLETVTFSNSTMPNLVNVGGMFRRSGLKEINFSKIFENIDTSKFNYMGSIFSECENLEHADISNVDLSGYLNDYSSPSIFSGCYKLKTIDFTNSKITHYFLDNMCSSCSALTSINFSNVEFVNSQYFRDYYFSKSLTSINFSGCKAPSLTEINGLFSGFTSLQTVDFSNSELPVITGMQDTFLHCTALTSANFSGVVFNEKVDMRRLFEDCGFTNINFSEMFSNVDTTKICNMNSIFDSCNELVNVDMSNVDLTGIESYNGYMPPRIIGNCNKLESVDFSNSKLNGIFMTAQPIYQCSALTSVNFSNADLTNATYFSLGTCSGLTSVNFSGCKAPSLTAMSFNSNETLSEVDFSNANLSALTNTFVMFNGCQLSSANFSNCNLQSVTSTTAMFVNCEELTNVNLSGVNLSSITQSDSMFSNCKSLVSIDMSNVICDPSNITNYSGMFNGITTSGTLIYNCDYEDAWNNILVTNQSTSNFPSTWTKTCNGTHGGNNPV